jgi:hypothetical protein
VNLLGEEGCRWEETGNKGCIMNIRGEYKALGLKTKEGEEKDLSA